MEGEPGRSRGRGRALSDTPAAATVPLAVVIPNLDGAHWLEGCLASIRAGRVQPAEIIVADDGSTDGSAEVCARHDATFLASRAPRGTGFAPTMNRGIASVSEKPTWLLILNNDTELDAECVAEIMRTARSRPEASILAPVVRSLRDPDVLDSAGLLLYPDGVARPRWHGERHADVPLREEPVLLASGAAMAVRRDLWTRNGPFDERLGSFVEDVDWGLRAARRGAIALLVPTALVSHHFSGTIGALSPRKARLVERNRVVVAARHLPVRDLLASPAWTVRRWLALRRTTDAAGGGRGVGLAALAGLLGGIGRLPRALAERRRLRLERLSGGPAWAARLRRHRCGPDAFSRFGGG